MYDPAGRPGVQLEKLEIHPDADYESSSLLEGEGTTLATDDPMEYTRTMRNACREIV